MRIAFRRTRRRMPEQRPDDVEAQTLARAGRGERMPQIVDPRGPALGVRLQLRLVPNPAPCAAVLSIRCYSHLRQTSNGGY